MTSAFDGKKWKNTLGNGWKWLVGAPEVVLLWLHVRVDWAHIPSYSKAWTRQVNLASLIWALGLSTEIHSSCTSESSNHAGRHLCLFIYKTKFRRPDMQSWTTLSIQKVPLERWSFPTSPVLVGVIWETSQPLRPPRMDIDLCIPQTRPVWGCQSGLPLEAADRGGDQKVDLWGGSPMTVPDRSCLGIK